jgi:type VI secretion system protein ImpA
LSILSGLTSARNPGSDVAGWLQVVDYVYQAAFCSPRGVPPITLDALDLAQSPVAPAEGGEGAAAVVDLGSLEAQIRSADPAQLTANRQLVQEAIEEARGIDAFLGATLGAGGSINFEELTDTLERLERTIGSYLEGGEGVSAGEGAATDAAGGPGAAPAITGAIRSRDDVVRLLDKMCDYYRQAEPGSPVPYLLRRAQKVALMNFVDAMNELALASPDQLKPAMGSAVEIPE